ncbi:MAG TPA: hypothetical protein VGN11_05545 [Candidatus Baltobacteraceae bacterium]|jgi:hypothetical protein|nr:hypothetical protein [Candidatus Baltobacteraceae bacterium]
MNNRTEATANTSVIEDWMIDLLEDDRPAGHGVAKRLSDDLGWIYPATFIHTN